MSLSLIARVLSRAIGLDPATLGPGGVSSAVKRRMRELGISDACDYASLVSEDSPELAALIEEIVVCETWFFRERAVFASLVSHAREALQGSRHRIYRVLSMPCSTGEEPYTISMALQDAGIAAERFCIDGIDISWRALKVALRATYGSASFRGHNAEFRDRHFSHTSEGYQVSSRIRQPVRLRHGNLVDPLLFTDQGQYDAILCRNVLIYLTNDARASVLSTIDRLLAADGIVVAGHAEALETMTPRLDRSEASSFVFTRRSAPRRAPRRESPKPRTKLAPATQLAARAAPPPSPAPPPAPPPAQHDLERAARLADGGNLEQAHAAVLRYLEQTRPTAAAFHLLGLIDRARKDLGSAERCFNKALYLDPGHEEALLHLALICEARGEAERARTLRRRAERAGRARGAA